MMKKTLLTRRALGAALIVLLLSAAGVNSAIAQDQIAVLQHEGVTTTYYGGNAFVDAYNAAENGDMITLSAGSFNTCQISKFITIHGAGSREDELVDDRTRTVFIYSVSIDCEGSETEHLIVEGVFCPSVRFVNMNYAEFYRCAFLSIEKYNSYNTSYNMSNSKFINCRIGSMAKSGSINVYLFNSIVQNVTNIDGTYSTDKNIIAYNSFIKYGEENPKCSDFYNCVVVGNEGHAPESTCTIYNSVMVKNGYEGSLLENAYDMGCLEVDELSQVFVDYTGDILNEMLILQDGITSSIQGNDGTEVGIYGGMYPWTDRPVYMIMRHCTVGSRTTDDGHLSVDIEVVTEP